MLTGILGEKLAMSQKFAANGKVLPVTQILAGPVTVVQIKKKDRDGYEAIQLAYGAKKKGKKPILGHVKKANLGKAPKILAEFPLKNGYLPKEGTIITVDQVFTPGDLVTVTGLSKGKGFTGVMKRWGFAGGPASHGQSDRLRAPGSIGQTTTPGRVFRGKKMAGRSGQLRVTVKNLQVIEVDKDKNLLVLSGSIPGGPRTILKIEKIGTPGGIGHAKKAFETYKPTEKEKVVEKIEEQEAEKILEGGGENAKDSKE